MKPLVWLGIALIIAWGVLWLGIKMAVFAVHLLLLIGVVLIGWGLLHRGHASRSSPSP
jgi:Flp pilus assembly protein TadB